MRLEIQKERFTTVNFLAPDEQLEHRHSSLLPNIIRAAICGPSGCGKTNTMLSLLLNRNGLKFENIYIFGKTLLQPKYQYLRTVLNSVPEIGFFTFQDSEELVEDVEPNSVCVFDDLIMDPQTNIQRYFSYGRHRELSCFYLTQCYVAVPRHLIRCNLNFLILFNQDELNLKHIYDEHISSPDLSFSTFKNICSMCWKDPFGYLTLDKSRSLNNGRFRKGIDTFIVDI